MAVTARQAAEPRWHRTFRSADTLADDLGSVGAWVGPRTGPDKRTHDEIEDYVLRYLLAAWKKTRLSFPFEISATRDEKDEPDFAFVWPDDHTLGVEVTAAGGEDHQARLTRTEGNPAHGAEMISEHGFVGEIPERKAAADIIRAIRRKVDDYRKGKYRTPDCCDLLVYDNTETESVSDKQQVVSFVRLSEGLTGWFRQVHLVADSTVFIDLFGNEFETVEVRNMYEIDYVNWIFDQVEHIRGGSVDQFDLANIAEELEDLGRADRRAIKRHLTKLLLHLLKWQHQPRKRSASWRFSISNARYEIEDLLKDSPSLERYLQNQIADRYDRARNAAASETGLSLESFPEDCPFEAEQLLDLDFIPGKDS